MSAPSLFKWRHFEADITLCAVRWYLRYALSYRDVEELLRERGITVDHTRCFVRSNVMRPNWSNAAVRS